MLTMSDKAWHMYTHMLAKKAILIMKFCLCDLTHCVHAGVILVYRGGRSLGRLAAALHRAVWTHATFDEVQRIHMLAKKVPLHCHYNGILRICRRHPGVQRRVEC